MSSGRIRSSGHNLKHQEIPFKHEKKLFHCKKQGKVAWAGCRVSTLGDTQNLTGCGPEQPSLGGAGLGRGIGLHDLKVAPSNFRDSVILFFFCLPVGRCLILKIWTQENTPLLWRWYSLHRQVVESSSVEVFKPQLDTVLEHLLWLTLLDNLKRSLPT